MTLDDALVDVDIAFLQVEFSIKLLSYCELEKINPAELDTNQIVLLEHQNLIFPPGKFSKPEDIVRAASVTVSLALGASALTLNKAWELPASAPVLVPKTARSNCAHSSIWCGARTPIAWLIRNGRYKAITCKCLMWIYRAGPSELIQMKYPPSEKLESIRLVERSHLPVRRTLDKAGYSDDHILSLVRSLSRL